MTPEIENEELETATNEENISKNELATQTGGGQIKDSVDEVETLTKIPDWVRNIFSLYVENKISENELLEAIKFLLAQKIIVV